MARRKLFVAASHSDEAWARGFVAELRSLGFDVWYDLDNLAPGSDITTGIEQGLQGRDIIVIVTPESLRSSWIQFEITIALTRGVKIIPVMHVQTAVHGVLANRFMLDAVNTDPRGAAHAVAGRLGLAEPAPVIRRIEGTHVFLSHASQDNSFTRKLQHDLESVGAYCWVDYDEITHGDFFARINDGLSQSNWLVLVISPSALAPEKGIIRREVDAAMGMISTREIHDIIGIVAAPFTIQTMPPLWRNLQRYDATNDYQSALEGLQRALNLA